jgi:two-component system sensor histidine kinase/response regulator
MSVQDQQDFSATTPQAQAVLRADEMTLIQSVSGHGLFAHTAAAIFAALTLVRSADPTHVVVWLVCMLIAVAIRFLLYVAYKRAQADLRADRYWQHIVVASNFLIGAAWGWAGYVFFSGTHSAAELTLVLAIAVAAASAQTISPTRETLAALLVPMLLPLVAKLMLIDYQSYAAPAVLAIALLLSMWFSLSRYRALLAASIDGYEQRSASDAAMIRGAETANRLFAQVVTERERAEAELKIAKQAADDANQAKGDFLAYTSHEIRTPLTAVIGFSDALLASQQTTVQQDYSRRIKGASARLLTLINDLLDLSKIEAGKLNVEYADFELRQTVDEVVHEQAVKAREKDINLELSVDANVPDALVGDSLRLRQILLNLIGNAIKFTPEKGKVITRVRLLDVANSAADGGSGSSRLAFSVTDTGIGIPADKLVTMFQRYTQADASTARQYGGTGLGLSICKSLVELMEGKIGVNSEAGKGSEFWFELPFKLTAASATVAVKSPAAVPAPAPAQPFKGMRVLVAEDNENNQLLIELLLKRQGVDVTIVGDGTEAVESLRGNEYDLVFMDLEMPTMGGIAAVTAIRAAEKTQGQGKHVNIVALSAHAPEEERDHCIAAGMDDYMMKPIDVKVLHALLQKFAPERIAANAVK